MLQWQCFKIFSVSPLKLKISWFPLAAHSPNVPIFWHPLSLWRESIGVSREKLWIFGQKIRTLWPGQIVRLFTRGCFQKVFWLCPGWIWLQNAAVCRRVSKMKVCFSVQPLLMFFWSEASLKVFLIWFRSKTACCQFQRPLAVTAYHGEIFNSIIHLYEPS